jgi:hypothetical protein
MSKTLNNQQRKVLSKLYEKQFATKATELQRSRSDDFAELLNKLNSTIKDKDFQTYVKAYETVQKLEKVLKDRYQNGDIDFTTGGYNTQPKLSYKTHAYSGSINPKLQKHNEGTSEVMERVEIAAQDAQTRIYGLDVTFEEIKKEIDNLLRGL